MRVGHYRIHLEAEPEGGFTVTVPALPGCVTWGRDYEQAIEKVGECIEGFLEGMVEAGQPIFQDLPPESPGDAQTMRRKGGHEVAEVRPINASEATEQRVRDLEARGVLQPPARKGRLKALARAPGALQRFLDSRVEGA